MEYAMTFRKRDHERDMKGRARMAVTARGELYSFPPLDLPDVKPCSPSGLRHGRIVGRLGQVL